VVVESPEGTGVLVGCSIPVRPTPDAEDKPHSNKAEKSTAAPTPPASWSRRLRRTHWIMAEGDIWTRRNAIDPPGQRR
jgi:hypothetical protein